MSSSSRDPIVAAVDEALAQGFVVVVYIRRNLNEDDRSALERVGKLDSVRELKLSIDKARILVADIIEARHVLARHAKERAARDKIAARAELCKTLASLDKLVRRHDPDETVLDALRLIGQFAYGIGRDGELALERLPRQTDARTALLRAAAWISSSVRRLRGRPHDRIVLAIARTVLGQISSDGLMRATGRRKKAAAGRRKS